MINVSILCGTKLNGMELKCFPQVGDFEVWSEDRAGAQHLLSFQSILMTRDSETAPSGRVQSSLPLIKSFAVSPLLSRGDDH
jgi:hypothetical protein